MAKRGKYGAEKRQKELKRLKKREAKLEKKRAKAGGDVPEELVDGDQSTEAAGDEQAETAEDVVEPEAETSEEKRSSEDS